MSDSKSDASVLNDDAEGGSIGEAAEPLLPTIERFATHYLRYNGLLGSIGANPSTHTAEVRFRSGPALAVVKAFPLGDRGWVNEAVAWALGSELSIGVPPQATLLVATPDEASDSKVPGLETALRAFGRVPLVLWCATRLDTKPPQQVWRMKWERVVLSKPYGLKLAAFDAWLGNCDRIAQNAPYWTTRGQIAAIDHERLAFGQDWLPGVPIHLDRLGGAVTHLMRALREAASTKKLRAVDVDVMVAELSLQSGLHARALDKVQAESQALISANFGPGPASHLLSFLSERATPEFVQERLEQLA